MDDKSGSRWRRIGFDEKLSKDAEKMLIHERTRKALAAKIQQSRAKAAVNQAVASGTVITTTGADDEAVAFWQQGDLELNTREALQERFQLRTRPAIEAALQLWWEAALRTEDAHEAAQMVVMGNQLGDSPAALHYHGYFLCLNPIYKALMDEYDPDEAESAIQEDWEKDVEGGTDEVGRDIFCDSIFELADMWTTGIGESEYLDFLSVLLEHVVHGGSETALYKPAELVGRLEDVHVGKDDHGEKTARQKRVKRMKKRRKGAMTIQAGARGARDRKAVRKRKSAVKTIQAGGRGKLARNEARARKEAIPVIQSEARGKAGRVKATKRKEAVVHVQAGARGMIARKDVRREKGALKATFQVTAAFGKDDYDEKDVARRLNEFVEGEIAKIDSALSSHGDILYVPLPTQEYAMDSIAAPPSRVTVGERKHASETYLTRHKGPNLKQKSRVFDFMNKPSRRELAKVEETKQHSKQGQPQRRVLPGIPRMKTMEPQMGHAERVGGGISFPSQAARAPQLLPGERQRAPFARPVEPAAYARPPPPEVKQMIFRSEMNAATDMLKEMEDLLRPGRIEKMRRGQGKSASKLQTSGRANKQVEEAYGVPVNGNGGQRGGRSRMTQAVSAPALPHRQVAARVAPRASRVAFADDPNAPSAWATSDTAPDADGPGKPLDPLKPTLAAPPALAPLVPDDGDHPPAGVRSRVAGPSTRLSLPSIA